MSVLDHLLLYKIRNADLHVPSPSVCQVYTGLHHHVCWCCSMNVRMRLPAASSPHPPPLPPSALLASSILFSCAEDPSALLRLPPSEHFHQHHPFISLSSITPHLKASVSPKQPSTASLSEFSPPASMNHMRQQQRRHILAWSTFPFLIFCFAGSAIATVPLSHLLRHRSLKCSRKSRQAVSSSSKSVRWLGSWSSAVPLEDDPVDEDGRDGPGGAAGEAQDSHPNHRWVRGTHMMPLISFCIVISEDLAGRLIFAYVLYFSNHLNQICNICWKWAYMSFLCTPPS